MHADSSEPSSARGGLADRALDLVEETSTALIALARYEPKTAVTLARQLYEKVADKSKSSVNSKTNASSPDKRRSSLGTERSDTALNVGAAVGHSDDEIRSCLKPSDIDQRSIRNRKLRGTLFDDIILTLLLENRERDLVAADIKNEFARLQIVVKENALLSRIARLREAKSLEPVVSTGTGIYRLSPDGMKTAQSAKDRRLSKK
jgi:hypothetical protein